MSVSKELKAFASDGTVADDSGKSKYFGDSGDTSVFVEFVVPQRGMATCLQVLSWLSTVQKLFFHSSKFVAR